MQIRKMMLPAGLLLALAVAVAARANGQAPPASGHWITAWSTAVHVPRTFQGAPRAPTLSNQTVREMIRPTIAGSRLRLRLSNELGATPLTLASVHIALADQNDNLIPGTDRALTFDGKSTVQIPAGAPMLSDPVDLNVPALASVAVSIYVDKDTSPTTFHLLGQRSTYISAPGNFTTAASIQSAKRIPSWYWLSDLEFWAPGSTCTLVTLGDSITDGFGAKAGDYQDWPDLLADRLAESSDAPALGIANEGIGGNRILFDGAGVSALARVDRDVLAKPGVAALILLEGINDIGWPNMKPFKLPNGSTLTNRFAGQVVTAADLILGMKQIVERAHAHGILVFGATMTPYQGASYYTPAGEDVRESVNQWIRTSGEFDGVVDFDNAVHDPAHPAQYRPEDDSGDHLHPNAAGYKAMAAAIDIAKLRTALLANSTPSNAKTAVR